MSAFNHVKEGWGLYKFIKIQSFELLEHLFIFLFKFCFEKINFHIDQYMV